MTSTSDLVSRFSAGFAGRALTDHGVVSGLGVWLLVALLAPAVQGASRGELEGLLGTDAEDAAARARELLAAPHPEVAEAVALWSRASELSQAFARWVTSLPEEVSQGPVPTQQEADRWAAEQTHDLIRKFPVGTTPEAVFVLASALVTQVAWEFPFLAAKQPLGGQFAEASEVLATPAALVAGQPTDATQLDAFDVDLGPGHAWTLTESERTIGGRAQRLTEARALLPTWGAQSDLDLKPEPWFGAVCDLLGSWVKDRPMGVDARQVAVAAYEREGFSAAAVTVIAACGGAPFPGGEHLVRVRELTVQFDRPYAVVACGGRPADWSDPAPAWNGLPVFNAWVGKPR